VVAELVDQVRFTRQPEYVFHHPLIRTVAYEAQLKSDRAELHRRVAAAIESGDPAAAEQNAALIAEHLEAAGDLHAAYGWHMRAAAWATNRDINAARLSPSPTPREYRLACWSPTIPWYARSTIPYGLPNDPVMTSRWPSPG
jgi:hypothetical protein